MKVLRVLRVLIQVLKFFEILSDFIKNSKSLFYVFFQTIKVDVPPLRVQISTYIQFSRAIHLAFSNILFTSFQVSYFNIYK